MNNEKIDSSAVYALFEEIKETLKKRPAQQPAPVQLPTESVIRREDLAEIREMAETLKAVMEAFRLPQKHTHKHTIDLMSNKALIVLAAAVSALIISLWIVRDQRYTIKQFRDNDLKYRYIQMKGQATPEDILMLRNVFDFNRNADSIKVIHKRVKRYEQLIQEKSEHQARARLNADEAEKLKHEAERLKNNLIQ